jgi:hypothetical protein
LKSTVVGLTTVIAIDSVLEPREFVAVICTIHVPGD